MTRPRALTWRARFIAAICTAGIAAASLAACGQEDKIPGAIERARKESFCLRWKGLEKGAELASSDAFGSVLKKSGNALLDKVPADKKDELDQALDAANKVSDAANNVSAEQKTKAREQILKIKAGFDSYCKGTLVG